jgi:hypothetical protein
VVGLKKWGCAPYYRSNSTDGIVRGHDVLGKPGGGVMFQSMGERIGLSQ